MKVELVRIGNSRGVRIPKPILEQCGFQDSADLSVESNRLVLSPTRQPRQGWDDAFRAAGRADDQLLLGDALRNAFDDEDWHW